MSSRWPRAWAVGCPSGPASAWARPGSCSRPATTAARSAATRCRARPRWPCSTTIADEHLLDQVKRVGEHLAHGLGGIDSPLVQGVRGSGLWRALVLTGAHASAVETAARQHGLLVNAVKPDVIRLAPPLILTEGDVDTAVPLLTARGRRGRGSGPAMTRHFLRDDDLSPDELVEVLDLADQHEGRPAPHHPLAGPQSVALLFDKQTLRTQLSFSVGVAELGGQRDRRRRPAGRDRGARVRRRRHPGAHPAGRGHRVAHLRPGPDRGDGRSTARCPWSTRSPTSSTRARCWPTCRPSASTSTGWPA